MPNGFLENLQLLSMSRGIFSRGDVVVHAGQKTDRLIILHSGSIKIGKTKIDSPGPILLSEFFALDGYQSTATAICAGEYYAAPRHAVKNALDQAAPITWPLARAAAGETITAQMGLAG